MHLLKYDPDAKTLTEVMLGEGAGDPTCRYFYVKGKRAAVPILTHDGIGEIVWEHPSYQPPRPTAQHRATDEQWHWQTIKELLPENPRSPLPACLLELRDRIQQLEAAQPPRPPVPAPKPNRSTLVDRVKHRLIKGVGGTWEETSCAVIREVAAWLNERDIETQNNPYCLEAPTADDATRWLRGESNQ